MANDNSFIAFLAYVYLGDLEFVCGLFCIARDF